MTAITRFISVMLLFLSVTCLTSATVQAQDPNVTVAADFADSGIVDRDITCVDAGDSNVTTGAVDALAFEGWTWERVNEHSLKIYNDEGKWVMTLVGAGNPNNSTGAITDGDSPGDWGGSWTM